MHSNRGGPARSEDGSGGTHLAAVRVLETYRTGLGVFTTKAVSAGELVFTLTGIEREWKSRTEADALANPNYFGLGNDLWLDPDPPYSFINHACSPNLVIRGERDLVSLRTILPGEELTLDYAITTSEVHWKMACLCGMPSCRSLIRSIQYLPWTVFERYLPYINPHFQDVFLRFHRAAERPVQQTAAPPPACTAVDGSHGRG